MEIELWKRVQLASFELHAELNKTKLNCIEIRGLIIHSLCLVRFILNLPISLPVL